MALSIGSVSANSGMSEAIYQELDRLLSPPLQKAVNDAEGDAKSKVQEALNAARNGWKKLAYAIAKGVVEHFIENMEIVGVQTKGNVNTTVEGATETESYHKHDVDLSGTELDVVFTQSNDGIGLVR